MGSGRRRESFIMVRKVATFPWLLLLTTAFLTACGSSQLPARPSERSPLFAFPGVNPLPEEDASVEEDAGDAGDEDSGDAGEEDTGPGDVEPGEDSGPSDVGPDDSGSLRPCFTAADCEGTGRICRAGFCDGDPNNRCRQDRECGPGEFCRFRDGLCLVRPEAGQPDTGVADVGATDTAPTDVSGPDRPLCASIFDPCGAGTVCCTNLACQSGRCLPPPVDGGPTDAAPDTGVDNAQQCRQNGQFCVTGDQCCTGLFCVNRVCTNNPDAGTCASEAQSCNTRPCCGSLICFNDICRSSIPDAGSDGGTDGGACRQLGQTCQPGQCCTGATCDFGICFPQQDAGRPDTGVTDTGPSDTGSDNAACRSTGQSCTVSEDCCTSLTCQSGTCKSTCRIDGDCPAGQVCLNSACQPRTGCTADSECTAPQKCISGKCQDPPPASRVVSCTITTPAGVIKQGQTKQFNAVAFDRSNNAVPGQTFTWSSSAASIASFAQPTTGVATGGAVAGTTKITAKVNGVNVSCGPVDLTNYLDPPVDVVRAIVRDAVSGKPIQGVTVQWLKPGTASAATGVTNANGEATASRTAVSSPATVTAYGVNHAYMTITNTSNLDVLFYLPPHVDTANNGAMTGSFDFSQASSTGNAKLGLAGLSFPTDILDLNFQSLIGETENVRVTLPIGGLPLPGVPNLPSSIDIPLPQSMQFELNSFFARVSKNSYRVVSQPGRRAAWGFGDRMQENDLFDFIIGLASGGLGGGGGGVNIGQVLPGLLQFIAKFQYHAAAPDIVIPARSSVGKNLKLNQQMNLATVVDVPLLPKFNNAYLDSAIITVTSAQPNAGLVPLGLSGGFDSTSAIARDGIVDKVGESLQDGQVALRISPLHDGLEGSKYATFLFAQPIRDLSSGLPALSSGIVQFSQTLPTNIVFNDEFLPFAQGSRHIRGSRTVNIATVTGADFYRVKYISTSGTVQRHWYVYTASPGSLTLPPLPGGREDRSQADVQVQVVDLVAGQSLESVFTFSAVNVDRLVEVINRFSVLGCGRSGTQALGCRIDN
ncbi:MAG: hypothetical protein GMKNLPBB_02089 [Myxococcota bacterium]|nr:hypothetical protein [Myxococcota bacterium]